MWQLTVNLRDTDQATQVISQIDARDEVTTGGARVTKYPDDRVVVAASLDRVPLAGLASWALTFSSARLALADDAGQSEY